MDIVRTTPMTPRPHFPPLPSTASPRYAVMSRVLQDVGAGAFSPDDLLTENRLIERYGVERAPLREALAVLAQAGILDQEHRVGVRVRRVGSVEVMHLLDLHRDIAKRSVAAVAEDPAPHGLAALGQEADAVAAAVRSGDANRLVTHTARFWVTLADVAGFEAAGDILADDYVKLRIAGWEAAEAAALSTAERSVLTLPGELKDLVDDLRGGEVYGARGTVGRCLLSLQARYADRPRPPAAVGADPSPAVVSRVAPRPARRSGPGATPVDRPPTP